MSSTDAIHDKESFVNYLTSLAVESKNGTWENNDLPRYLAAMNAWVEDMEGYYINRGEKVPDQPTWKILADILRAATMYE
jgi:hypothetical protein